jgi:hypothetical protein
VKVRCWKPSDWKRQTIRMRSPRSATPNVPAGPPGSRSVGAPGWNGLPFSETPISSIRSPERRGISRKPYVNEPEKATVIASSTATEPSGLTVACTALETSS